MGYGFQVDLAWRVAKLGLTIVERPITFVERELGASKMSGNIVVEAMINVTKWGLTARWNKLTGKKAAASSPSQRAQQQRAGPATVDTDGYGPGPACQTARGLGWPCPALSARPSGVRRGVRAGS